MLHTISSEKLKEMLESALKNYETESNLIKFVMNGGAAVALVKMLEELDGISEEEIQPYRDRINGIGELRQMGFGEMSTLNDSIKELNKK